MSDKVTPQRVEAIRELYKHADPNGKPIMADSLISDLLAYIDQQSAPAPEVEVFGWGQAFEYYFAAQQQWRLQYEAALEPTLFEYHENAGKARNFLEPFPLIRLSSHLSALAAKEDRVRVLEDVVIQLRCQKAGDKLVIGTRGDRIAKFKDEITALTAENAKLRGVVEAADRPKIVCLCGSTRFFETFQEASLQETLDGKIVLSIGCNLRNDKQQWADPKEREAIKIRLDELHKRKIDLCDEVLVLNVGGYIGESTRSEIDYAIAHNKPVRYLETAALSKGESHE